MMKRRIAGLIVSLSAAIDGCSSPPVLQPPVRSALQQQWVAAPLNVRNPDCVPLPTAWWQVFHDPLLDQLMQQGLQRNLDIKLAQARIYQARATSRAAAAALWPQTSVGLTDQTTHTPRTLIPLGLQQTDLQAALNATWTIDLSGTLRNQKHAAEAALLAAQFDRDATKLNLLAQIAQTYLQYRLAQLQYVISQRSATSQAETVRITRVRFEQGAASRLDLERVESQLALTRAAVPQAFEQSESARSTLILLLASTPEELALELPETIAENPELPSSASLEVLLTPAQVIALRPDIRSAEWQLASAAANFKAARAQRYPQLTLAALFGTAGTAVSELMTRSSKIWSYSAGLTAPLFDFGRIRASIDFADAQQQQAFIVYEQTVRGALQATQAAVVLYAQGELRAQQMQIALDSSKTAAQLARRQYQEGVLSLLEVLDAERTAYDTELNWSQAAAAVSERLVTLYQTMGVLPPPDLNAG